MSISEREKLEIAEVVMRVLDARLAQMSKDIVAGFAECIDWHNENFAKIIQARNDSTMAELLKAKREVIEIHTREQSDAKRKSERLGFKKAKERQ